MTVQDVYDEIKAVLKYFDLQFCQMNEVDFMVSDDELIFTCQNRSVIVSVPPTDE